MGSASLFFTGVVSFNSPGVAKQSRPLVLPANAGVLAFPNGPSLESTKGSGVAPINELQ